jgi:ribosomal protein S18 acetylase RimI-like enzyme
MQPVFRKAVTADIPAMARLLTLAWQKAYRGIVSNSFLDSLNPQDSEIRIRAGMETKPEFRYSVLDIAGEIAGVSVVCPCWDGDLPGASDIQVFYIHPNRQGQGLGRRMMHETLAAIRSSGNSPVTLWVLQDNHSARAFYEKMGFAPDGREKRLAHLENLSEVRYQYIGQEQAHEGL